MEVTIKEQKNSVLTRKEIIAEVTFEETTPSRMQLKQSIATKTKSKPELLIVKNIYNTYGEKKATVKAYAYETEEAMNAIEYPKAVEKNKQKEEPKEEKPAEEPKAEAPAEEKKEE